MISIYISVTMLSIFDIPTKKEDLTSVNQGIADLRYDEVQSLRNLSDDATNSRFSGQEITFRWDYANGKWWIPSRSYFRIRVKLTKDGTIPLGQNDNIAPNMGMADSMIQQVQYKLADKTVEDISNFYPQVASLKTRLGKTAQWLKTTGNNLNFWESSPVKRQQHICQDGYLESDTMKQHNMTPLVTYRTQLGIAAAGTVVFTRNTRVVTFAAAGVDLRTANIFRPYDWIVLKDIDVVGGDTNKYRMYMVTNITGALTMLVAPTSVAAGAATFPAAGAANIDFWRVRYSEVLSHEQVASNADQYLANNILQHNALSASPPLGIPILSDGGNGRAAQVVAFAGAQLSGTTFAVHTSVDEFAAAAVNNQLRHHIGHSRFKYTSAAELGIPATARVGLLAQDGGGNEQRYELYWSVPDQNTTLPDLRKIFKKGDFIVYGLSAAANNVARVAMVWDVDVLGVDGSTATEFQYSQVLHVITSDVLGAAGEGYAAGGPQTSIPLGRVQLGGPTIPDKRVNDARNVTEFELIWKPALSIFDLPHALPGSAKNEIVITPFADTIYQAKAIESVDGTGKTHRDDYVLEIQDMRLYNAVCEGPLVTQAQYILDLQETRCQNIPITTASRSQWTIDVSPSLNAITVAFQDQSAVQLPQYSNTRFKVRDDLELSLEEFYVRISQLQRPQPNADLLYLEYRGQDLLTEVYSRNMFYNGGYYDSSQETLKEWRDRGWYLHYAVPRTGTDRSTRCNISTKFRSTGNTSLANNANILVFHHYKKVCIIQLDQGRVTSMRISNA